LASCCHIQGKGAETIIYLAFSEAVAKISGAYFYRPAVEPAKEGRDDEAGRQLWEESVRLAELEPVLVRFDYSGNRAGRSIPSPNSICVNAAVRGGEGLMAYTLTQRVKSDELLQERSLKLWLRIAGLMTAAVLMFIGVYYFIAALDVPQPR
jgi:hypothetical protein